MHRLYPYVICFLLVAGVGVGYICYRSEHAILRHTAAPVVVTTRALEPVLADLLSPQESRTPAFLHQALCLDTARTIRTPDKYTLYHSCIQAFQSGLFREHFVSSKEETSDEISYLGAPSVCIARDALQARFPALSEAPKGSLVINPNVLYMSSHSRQSSVYLHLRFLRDCLADFEVTLIDR